MLDQILKNRPACLAKFDVSRQEITSEISVSFELRCLHCKSDALRILCYPIVAEDDDTYDGVAAGDVVERSPHHVECSTCTSRELLFDPEQHGYDGALGHGSSYERGEGDERPIDVGNAAYVTKVEFFYQIEPSELVEIAADSGVPVQDLFDGVAIYAVGSDGEVIKQLGFECA